jgi:transposase
MTRKTRRRFNPQEKLKILRLHLLEDRPISALCEEHGIQPTLFYQWQKTFFDNGTAAFEGRTQRPSTDQQIISRLQDQLRHKDEVLAEIASEMVRLKKELGENSR